MNDVGEGLAILRSKTGGQYGLIADEVTVVFNVSSKATSNGKLGITAQNIPISGGLLGGNASAELANESNRGNTITIKLKNIATAEMKGDRTLVENCTRRGDCSGIFNVPAPSAPPVPK